MSSNQKGHYTGFMTIFLVKCHRIHYENKQKHVLFAGQNSRQIYMFIVMFYGQFKDKARGMPKNCLFRGIKEKVLLVERTTETSKFNCFLFFVTVFDYHFE